MDALSGLADGFAVALAPGNLLWALAGVTLGTAVGVLPGIGPALTVALLGSCAIVGVLRVRRGLVLRYAAITAVLTIAVIGGARAVFTGFLRPEYTKDKVLASMHLLQPQVAAVVLKTPPPVEPPDGRPVLQSIQARGVLRVGYMTDSLPFAFFNESGDLVGLDVELAHRLAAELGIPVTQVTNYLAFARRELRRLVLERLQTLCATDEEFRLEARDFLGVDPA